MPIIESPNNGSFKKLLGLTTAKGLKAERLFLLSGEKLVREFLAKPNLKIVYEITEPALKPVAKSTPQLQFSALLFQRIDVLGTDFNILVLAQPPIATLKSNDLLTYVPHTIEAVVPVGDPGNLGALIRSCEAFGVPRIILTKEAAHPFLPKSVKASAGSVLRLPIIRGPALAEFPDTCIALAMDGTPIKNFIWPKNGLLVVGEEGQGLGKAVRGKSRFACRVSIPMTNVESLNVVVAASIALAHKAGCV